MAAAVPGTTDVVILCGGRGTRLGALTETLPKPLLPVGRAPFLQHLLMQLAQEGFGRCILAAHYLADRVRAFAQEMREAGLQVEVVEEPEPLGTGGGLRHAARAVRSATFIAMNGDSYVAEPLGMVLAQHHQEDREATLVAVRASHLAGPGFRKGVWRLGPEGEILGFRTEADAADGWINAGVYVWRRELLASWPAGAFSLEDHLESLLRGRRARVVRSEARLVDIGTPECYAWANRMMAQAPSLTLAVTGMTRS